MQKLNVRISGGDSCKEVSGWKELLHEKKNCETSIITVRKKFEWEGKNGQQINIMQSTNYAIS